jgi:hypothetical protein
MQMTTEPERDWERAFDLAAWQQRPAAWRQEWISEHVWRRPELGPGEDHAGFRRRHYERGHTA